MLFQILAADIKTGGTKSKKDGEMMKKRRNQQQA